MSQIKKFELISSEIGFQGRAFTLRKDYLRTPDGREVVYEIIDHPGAVTIIPVTNEGKILFVHQYRPATGMVLLELPAGTLNPGEDPAECAAREVREETGMAARKLTHLGNLWLAPGYSTEYLRYYLAEDLYPAPLEQDEDEFIEVEAIRIEDAFAMIPRGELVDAKSLAGLMMLRARGSA